MVREVFLLLSLALLGTASTTAPPATATRPIEIVLSRCKENIQWVEDRGYGDIATVYEKCDVTDGPGRHVLVGNNNGREAGTYLRHIVDQYEALADWTVFSLAEEPSFGAADQVVGEGVSNVPFSDFVNAAEHRSTTPQFFVFTTALVMDGAQVFQCMRSGSGTEPSESTTDRSVACGAIKDWQRWFRLPEWFQVMVEKLMREQVAPLDGFNLRDVLDLFGVEPASGVILYTQGSRFAASREAIQRRPKEYYERLLGYMANPDPWAGYYLEWLWWYVLGGEPAPCGFEGAVMQTQQVWRELVGKLRPEFEEAVGTNSSGSGSGSSNFDSLLPADRTGSINSASGNSVTLNGVIFVVKLFIGYNEISIAQTFDTNTRSVSFQSGSTTVFNGATSFSGAGVMVATSCTLIVRSVMTVLVKTAIRSTKLAISSGIRFIVRQVSVEFTAVETVGRGILQLGFGGLGTRIRITTCTMVTKLVVVGTSASRRTNLASYTVTDLCGSTLSGGLSLDSSSAVQLELLCQVSGTSFSNSIQSLTYTSGSIILLNNINGSSLPTFINSLSNPASAPLEAVSACTGQCSVKVLVFGNPGSCPTGFPNSIMDNCLNGYTCQLIGGVDPTNSAQCMVYFSQQLNSSSGSDGALYGLIALVALVPICLVAGVAAYYYFFRNPDTMDVPLDPAYYPAQPYPNPYPANPYPAQPYPAQPYMASPYATPVTPAGIPQVQLTPVPYYPM